MDERNEVDNAAFLEAMERDFQHVIAEMSGDQSIERFRKQFQSLYENLRRSHDNERAILLKCKELNNNISMGLSYIKNSEGLTRKDAQTIQLLASELEKAKSVISIAQTKGEKDKAKIEHLQLVLNDLKLVIKESEGVQSGKTNEIYRLNQESLSLQREKEDIDKECETLNTERNKYTEDLKAIRNAQQGLEADLRKERQTLKETNDRIEKDQKRASKQQEEMDKISKERDSILKERDIIMKDLAEKAKRSATLEEEIGRLNKEIEEKKNIKANKDKINATFREKIEEIKREINSKIEHNKILDDEIKQLTGSVIENNLELAQMRRNKEKRITEIQRITNERDEAYKMVHMFLKQASELQREIEHTDKTGDKDQGLVDNLLRDQNTIKKNFISIVKENQQQQIELENRTRDCEGIKEEVRDANKEVTKRVKSINDLEVENEKYVKEAKQAIKKYLHLSEEVKLKDNLISEFQKKTQETDARLKHQQQLYEAVRSDRNLYSKNLTETQDEIAEIKLRYKIVMHQISQLKEEIDAKEKALNQEYYKAKDAEKKYQNLKKENEKYKQEIVERTQMILNLKNEIGKLQSIMKESEGARLKLKEQYESVVSDRDILGTQLIRRNDELALIYEKIKMQQNTLAKGEADYRERVSDIDILDNTIKDLTRELTIYKRRAGELGKYYTKIDGIRKELVEEKLKVKGLSEELENPKNKYRWRNLEGSDCDTNELISKIENLQKRLIAKTEEVVAKDLVINTQEQTIKNLEQVMEKQPGLAEAEEISYYQQMIKSRTRKLKALAAELNMYQAQSNEFKYEIEKLTEEVSQVKKALYDIRRKEQLLIEQERKERRDQEDRTGEENIQML